MGLFGGDKEVCAICGGKLSLLTSARAVDGKICHDCHEKCTPLMQIGTKTISEIKSNIAEREALVDDFRPTDVAAQYLQVDKSSKTWRCPGMYGKKKIPDVFKFSDLLNYELIEDRTSIIKGGLGSAIAGGFLFGGAGAIVGGGLGKKHKDLCNSMSIMVSVRNPYISTFEIKLISTETKKGRMLYKMIKKTANEIIALFSIISGMSENSDGQQPRFASSADEILKYKQLADAGVITPDEFEAKKKQLLGL